MKFCDRPWTFMYVIDAEHEQVWPCPWGNEWMNMGNILEEDIEKLFRCGGNIEKLRESILDGSFRYCDPQKCTYLANGWLPDLTEEEIKEITKNKKPYEFNLAYEETCNHACSSCRKDYFKGDQAYYEKVDLIGVKLLPYLDEAKQVSANGRGEVFCSEHILSVLERMRPKREDFKLFLETNAALFDAQHWKRVEHLGKYYVKVTATVNSFHDSTYRFLNGYSNHVDQVLENLHFIRTLREEGIVDKFVLSMVVQEANFRELPEFVDRCLNEFGADEVRLRAIIQFGMDADEYWFKDIYNPAHPCYREAIDILHHPVLQDKRVWYWEGDYESVRKPKEMPVRRFEQYYNLLWQMCRLDDDGQLEDIFQAFRYKAVAMYSAGHLTEYIVRKMQKFGMEPPHCIYDKNRYGGTISGVPVCLFNEETKIDAAIEVIINPLSFYRMEIEEELNAIGYCGKIVDLEELIVSQGKK